MKTIEIVLTWAILIVLSGCQAAPFVGPGEIAALQPATALRGIELAQSAAPFTEVWEASQGTVYVWPQSGGIGFFCAQGNPCLSAFQELAQKVGGNWVTTPTWGVVAKTLTQLGFVRSTAAAVRALKGAIQGGGFQTLTVIVIAPGVFPTEMWKDNSLK